MKKLWITATVLFMACSSSFASVITWTTDAIISDETDVLTSGTKVEAFNLTTFVDRLSPRTVNGVVFDGLNLNGAGSFSGFFEGSTGSLDYNAMLNTAGFNIPQPLSLGNGNLLEGRTYAIQIWYADDRACCANRTGFYSDGSAPVANQPNRQVYLTASNDEGFGEYGIGTFTADGTGSQSLNIGVGSALQLNAYQIRDITAVSAPATVGMLGLGLLSTLLFRRKFQS